MIWINIHQGYLDLPKHLKYLKPGPHSLRGPLSREILLTMKFEIAGKWYHIISRSHIFNVCYSRFNSTAQEIDKHCRQAIIDDHRWINQWASKHWTTPHVHGDLCEVVDASQLLSTDQGTFKDHVEQSRSMTMKRHQFCFSHGMECETRRSGDVEFSGLRCEENSRCNAKRKFMEGRFKRLYSTWARRHTILETPLIVLENTEEPWIDSNFVFISI
jgi:hypothetical protein